VKVAKEEPWLPSPFRQLSQEVDRLFDELIYRPWKRDRSETEEWNPQLDLYEDTAAFILEADLPGVQEPDISVTVEERDLVLQGKRSCERVTTAGNYHCRERRSGQFVRRLRLPASVAQEHIRVEFRDGVLRVTLPKLPEEKPDSE
jgi:HSP20 family protein